MKELLLGVKIAPVQFPIQRESLDSVTGWCPPQETISSKIGRHDSNPIDEEAPDVLDDIQNSHVENAVLHADKLDAADNGQEQ